MTIDNEPEFSLNLSSELLSLLRGGANTAQRGNSPPQAVHLLELLLENTLYPVYWKDNKGVYCACNFAFARALGMNAPSDIIGKTDADLVKDPELLQAYQEIDEEVLGSDLPYISYDFVAYNPGNPERRWVRSYKYPVKDDMGKVSGILCIIRDEQDTQYTPGHLEKGA